MAGAHLAMQLGSGRKNETFETYCRKLGLVEKPRKLTEEERKAVVEHSKAVVARIAESYVRKRK